MTVTVVVGAQWGDEAKGKFVDLLAQEAVLVARFNGGDNAGHTVVNPFGTFKLRLAPTGFANPRTHCVIGPGVVLNLATLAQEVHYIEQSGIDLRERLWVSPRCNVVMPYHPLIETVYEEAKGAGKTGTTRRGMGPTYADKVSYNGIRLFDLANPKQFAEKLRIQLSVKNPILQAFGLEPLDFEAVRQEKLEQYERIRPMAREPFGLVQKTLSAGQPILLEGAQGAMLDNDWGTYPYCTASTTLASEATAGLGVAPRHINRVIAVAKAYTTRVGAGPMPTELFGEEGQALRDAGQEYGTVTRRPRRCGWFDAELVRFTCTLNGCSELALTKLDVLDGLETIRIGVGYRTAGGERAHYWDGDAHWLEGVQAVYEELEGWQQPTTEVRRWDQLPPQAQRYVQRVEELVGTPVRWVSVGPGREETIPLEDKVAVK